MKRLLITLVVLGALVGGVFAAAASINVGGVDRLGAGGAQVVANPNVTDVSWTLDPLDSTRVDTVTVTFAADLAVGTTVALRLGAVAGGDCVGTILDTAQVEPDGDDEAIFDVDEAASAINCVGVSYTEPQ